jgi:dTDP-4-amino-4,6-dideoxygalactose transaminase
MISLFQVGMSDEAVQKTKETLQSGYITQGPRVEEFEKELQSKLKTPYVVTTNSATSAEHLILHMLKRDMPMGLNQEGWPTLKTDILTSPLTCTATNWPILANDYNIKWVDVDSSTLNMDLHDLQSKITPKTAAIMMVMWGGMPIDFEHLENILDDVEHYLGYRIPVILDCAHAFGSTYKGKQLPELGYYCTYSFQAIKHLCCGDGGALILPTEDEYKRAKLLRWYGIDRENNSKDFRVEDDVAEWGFKFHMNDINASIGLGNIINIDEKIEGHRNCASYYNKALKGVEGVSLLDNNPDYNSSYWIYTIRVKDRDKFMDHMKEKDIMVTRVHERNDKHSCVEVSLIDLPVLDEVSSDMICIPCGWWITEEERKYIVDSIKEGW